MNLRRLASSPRHRRPRCFHDDADVAVRAAFTLVRVLVSVRLYTLIVVVVSRVDEASAHLRAFRICGDDSAGARIAPASDASAVRGALDQVARDVAAQHRPCGDVRHVSDGEMRLLRHVFDSRRRGEGGARRRVQVPRLSRRAPRPSFGRVSPPSRCRRRQHSHGGEVRDAPRRTRTDASCGRQPSRRRGGRQRRRRG